MKVPLDKWSRDFTSLLIQQAADLARWKEQLRPEVYAELEAYCRDANRPVTAEVLADRASLSSYKAGGLHVCPTGLELYQILFDRSRFEESIQYVLRSDMAVVASAKNAKSTQNQNNIMKQVATKFAAIAALFTEISELLENAPEGTTTAPEPSGPTLESIAELAGKKDPKLAGKVLAKFGAELNDGVVTDLDEGDFAKAIEKLEALDDVEGGDDEKAPAEEKPKGGKAKTIDIEVLRELAQELITDGKSSQIKKALEKFKAEKIAKLEEKHYPAFHAELLKLQK